MAKRLTDATKWRNGWFRELPNEAKLAWIYICDECDCAGVWRADYGLATFQLGFDLSAEKLSKWFGDKLDFLGSSKVFIIPFFEFQYGESKDTWSAKVKAKRQIEGLGYLISNNCVLRPHSGGTVVHSGGTVAHSGPTVLSTSISKCISTDLNPSNETSTKYEPANAAQQFDDHFRRADELNQVRDMLGQAIAPDPLTPALKRIVGDLLRYCGTVEDVAEYLNRIVQEQPPSKGKHDRGLPPTTYIERRIVNELRQAKELVRAL